MIEKINEDEKERRQGKERKSSEKYGNTGNMKKKNKGTKMKNKNAKQGT